MDHMPYFAPVVHPNYGKFLVGGPGYQNFGSLAQNESQKILASGGPQVGGRRSLPGWPYQDQTDVFQMLGWWWVVVVAG